MDRVRACVRAWRDENWGWLGENGGGGVVGGSLRRVSTGDRAQPVQADSSHSLPLRARRRFSQWHSMTCAVCGERQGWHRLGPLGVSGSSNPRPGVTTCSYTTCMMYLLPTLPTYLLYSPTATTARTPTTMDDMRPCTFIHPSIHPSIHID